MSKFLRQKWSGHIFVWSARLAERDDMEPWEPAPPAAPPEPPEAVLAPSPTPETPAQNSAQPAPLDAALKTFRQEAGKPPKRKGEA